MRSCMSLGVDSGGEEYHPIWRVHVIGRSLPIDTPSRFPIATQTGQGEAQRIIRTLTPSKMQHDGVVSL